MEILLFSVFDHDLEWDSREISNYVDIDPPSWRNSDDW